MSAASNPVATRPLYWSVRRELWENRSVFLVPTITAVFVLLAILISLRGLPLAMAALSGMDPDEQAALLGKPFSYAAVPIVVSALLVAVFYCLDALHGERRDRSILFWKSLPVSDLTTVLSKAVIALVVVPSLAFVMVVVTWVVILLASTVTLAMHGQGAALLWTGVPWPQRLVALFYALATITLWYAPVYAWLLLVSGWARRMTFLVAVLPPLGLCVIERIAFGTVYAASLLQDRLVGGQREALVAGAGNPFAIDHLALLDPVGFLTSPGLWAGLVVAAALLYAAARLRRVQAPL